MNELHMRRYLSRLNTLKEFNILVFEGHTQLGGKKPIKKNQCGSIMTPSSL